MHDSPEKDTQKKNFLWQSQKPHKKAKKDNKIPQNPIKKPQKITKNIQNSLQFEKMHDPP